MTAAELVELLGGTVVTGPKMDSVVTGCYVSDLLSDVLSSSEKGQFWVTQHTHPNVVAVAAVKGLSAVLVVGGKTVAEDTVVRAGSEDVNIITSGLSAFEAAGRIYTLLEKEGVG
ncbi:MAG: hypothetical protein KAR83_03820 [Thermodesulfovibrionales bacterium]|nr:hypothetical protein [Thermodesulfovibrionales bacterium]